MSPGTCETCGAFLSIGNDRGQCRMSPPQRVPIDARQRHDAGMDGAYAHSDWPIVRDDDWCLAHKPYPSDENLVIKPMPPDDEKSAVYTGLSARYIDADGLTLSDHDAE